MPAANRSINEAIERSNEDWRIWLVATRLRAKAGDEAGAREALRRTRALVPPSPRPWEPAERHRPALKHPTRVLAGLASVSRPPIQKERRPDR